MSLDLVFTDVGVAAAVAADGQGLQLAITEVALGSGAWSPDSTAAALDTEIKRLASFGATVVEPGKIHITIRDDSADTYDLREIGLYDENGDLFAVYSQADPIISKSADSKLLVSSYIYLTAVPAGSVTITGNEFDYPPASDSVRGTVELATLAEMLVGTDAERVPPVNVVKDFLDDSLRGYPIAMPVSSPPSGFLEAAGMLLQRALYPELWAWVQANAVVVSDADWLADRWGAYSSGDGSTTFRLPDLRGEFVRGWDNGRGADPDVGRLLGQSQDHELESHSHTIPGTVRGDSGDSTQGPDNPDDGVDVTETNPYGGDETRPRNIAWMYCIRY